MSTIAVTAIVQSRINALNRAGAALSWSMSGMELLLLALGFCARWMAK